MGILEVLMQVLLIGKDHFTDVVLIIAIALLAFFQIRQTRKVQSNSEEAKNSCNEILKNQQTTIPSVSRKMAQVVKNSATINRELDAIVNKLRADRGWVYLFHNAGYDFLGQPFAKVTNTNESINPGVESLIGQMKNVPVGVMACFVEKLLNEQEVRVHDIEQYRENDRTTYLYLYTLGVKSTYAIAMFASSPEHFYSTDPNRSSKGYIPLGFVGLDYVRDYRKLSDEEFRRLHNSTMTIKGLLIERQREEINQSGYNLVKG